MILFRLFISKKLNRFTEQEISDRNMVTPLRIWKISVVLMLLSCLVLFVQTGFKIPLLDAIGKGSYEVAQARASIASSISTNLFQVAIHIFLPASLISALFFLRKKEYILISIACGLALISFSLAKSPLIDITVQLIIATAICKKIPLRRLGKYLLIPFVLLFAFLALASSVQGMDLVNAMVQRIFMGEFVPLPYYFTVFQDWQCPLFPDALPPYVQRFFAGAESLQNPAKIVILEMFPDREEIAGVANTYFIGSAFAYMGNAGIIWGTLLAFLNFFIITCFFVKLPKNALNIIVFSYLLYKLMHGLNGGVNYFMFSSIQLVFISFVIFNLFFAGKGNDSSHRLWTGQPVIDK